MAEKNFSEMFDFLMKKKEEPSTPAARTEDASKKSDDWMDMSSQFKTSSTVSFSSSRGFNQEGDIFVKQQTGFQKTGRDFSDGDNSRVFESGQKQEFASGRFEESEKGVRSQEGFKISVERRQFNTDEEAARQEEIRKTVLAITSRAESGSKGQDMFNVVSSEKRDVDPKKDAAFALALEVAEKNRASQEKFNVSLTKKDEDDETARILEQAARRRAFLEASGDGNGTKSVNTRFGEAERRKVAQEMFTISKNDDDDAETARILERAAKRQVDEKIKASVGDGDRRDSIEKMLEEAERRKASPQSYGISKNDDDNETARILEQAAKRKALLDSSPAAFKVTTTETKPKVFTAYEEDEEAKRQAARKRALLDLSQEKTQPSSGSQRTTKKDFWSDDGGDGTARILEEAAKRKAQMMSNQEVFELPNSNGNRNKTSISKEFDVGNARKDVNIKEDEPKKSRSEMVRPMLAARQNQSDSKVSISKAQKQRAAASTNKTESVCEEALQNFLKVLQSHIEMDSMEETAAEEMSEEPDDAAEDAKITTNIVKSTKMEKVLDTAGRESAMLKIVEILLSFDDSNIYVPSARLQAAPDNNSAEKLETFLKFLVDYNPEITTKAVNHSQSSKTIAHEKCDQEAALKVLLDDLLAKEGSMDHSLQMALKTTKISCDDGKDMTELLLLLQDLLNNSDVEPPRPKKIEIIEDRTQIVEASLETLADLLEQVEVNHECGHPDRIDECSGNRKNPQLYQTNLQNLVEVFTEHCVVDVYHCAIKKEDRVFERNPQKLETFVEVLLSLEVEAETETPFITRKLEKPHCSKDGCGDLEKFLTVWREYSCEVFHAAPKKVVCDMPDDFSYHEKLETLIHHIHEHHLHRHDAAADDDCTAILFKETSCNYTKEDDFCPDRHLHFHKLVEIIKSQHEQVTSDVVVPHCSDCHCHQCYPDKDTGFMSLVEILRDEDCKVSSEKIEELKSTDEEVKEELISINTEI